MLNRSARGPYGRRRRSPAKLIFIVLLLVVLAAAGIWISRKDTGEPHQSTGTTSETPSEAEPETPDLRHPDLQKLAEDWDSGHRGTYSIVITDESGDQLAAVNADRQYFMASIYKLYVAYVGYQKVDSGQYKLDEPYWNGWTRGKCLDEMIRTSHSPCGEKMMAELGRPYLAEVLERYGITETAWGAFTTNAPDAAIVLGRLQRGQDLADASRGRMLDSLKGQVYRDALAGGFAPLTVYDKVGFREQDEYHDVGIVELADGRHIIISVMTSGAGSRNIAGLAEAIRTAYAGL
jgi:hypothetical protein